MPQKGFGSGRQTHKKSYFSGRTTFLLLMKEKCLFLSGSGGLTLASELSGSTSLNPIFFFFPDSFYPSGSSVRLVICLLLHFPVLWIRIRILKWENGSGKGSGSAKKRPKI